MLHRAVISIIFLLLTVLLLSGALPASAAESNCGIEFTPAIGIPGSDIFKAGIPVRLNCSSVGEYIKAIYTFSIYAGSILAVVVLMIGGFIWLTAGGNVSQVGQARSYIGGAIAGFVLLLLSWTLLQTINPKLVKFEPLSINPIGRVDLSPAATFCCICSRGGNADPIDNKCNPIPLFDPGGTCQCPGRTPIVVPNAAACQGTFGVSCSFIANSPYEMRKRAQTECKQQEAKLGLICDLAPENGRCAESAACQASLAAAGVAGGCADDNECRGGAVCNHAWQCSTFLDTIGSPISSGQKVPLSGRGCCKPLGYANDTCVRNSDCNKGLGCQGGYEGDASSWRLITRGNYVNPPTVGVCR